MKKEIEFRELYEAIQIWDEGKFVKKVDLF